MKSADVKLILPHFAKAFPRRILPSKLQHLTVISINIITHSIRILGKKPSVFIIKYEDAVFNRNHNIAFPVENATFPIIIAVTDTYKPPLRINFNIILIFAKCNHPAVRRNNNISLSVSQIIAAQRFIIDH